MSIRSWVCFTMTISVKMQTACQRGYHQDIFKTWGLTKLYFCFQSTTKSLSLPWVHISHQTNYIYTSKAMGGGILPSHKYTEKAKTLRIVRESLHGEYRVLLSKCGSYRPPGNEGENEPAVCGNRGREVPKILPRPISFHPL